MLVRLIMLGALALAGLPLATAQSAAPEPGPAPTPGAGLEASRVADFFDAAMFTELAAEDIPGAVVSVVQDGRIIFSRGYGFADAGQTRPVDPQTTLFRPGSISKLFTWTAVMQLSEQGRVDLDADVNLYLGGTGIEIPEAFGGPVTLRHLLSHTAGFEDGAIGFLFTDSADGLRPLGEVMADHIPRRVREAGSFSAYSNWGAALAGLIVQNVSGEPFDTYIHNHILAPLGMEHSSFTEPLPGALAATMAEGLNREAGLMTDKGFEFIGNFGPAGALTASADDMARFMMAHLQRGAYGGTRILQPATADLMHSRLSGHHDGVPGMAYGFYEQEINGHRLIVHGGDTLWFHSNLVLFPQQGLGIFISTNAPAGAGIRGDLLDAFMDVFYPAGPLDGLVADPDFDASPYVGTYRYNRRAWSSFEKISALGSDITVAAAEGGAVQVTNGDTTRRYVALGGDLFRRLDGEDRIAFSRDADGRVMHLTRWNLPIMAGDRITPLETTPIQLLLAGSCLFVFVNIVFGSLIHFRRVFAMKPGERLARLTLFAIALVHLVFLTGLVVVASLAGNAILFHLPPSISVLLGLPVLAIPLTALAVILAGRSWLRGYWSLLGRIRYTLATLVAIGFLVFLNYWNLIGWHYG